MAEEIELIEPKEIFQVGDKVFDIMYGWGVVDRIDKALLLYPIIVKYKNYADEQYAYNIRGVNNARSTTPTLSFTEYTLNNFSQERLPFELPDVGEEIMCSDCNGDAWDLCIFEEYRSNESHPVVTNGGNYKHFKRLRQ